MAGLGNPGPAYESTRHNAGFWLVEQLARVLGLSFSQPWFKNYEQASVSWGEHKLYLMRPLTFMNRSGDAVERFFWKHRLEFDQLLVAVDQMDLPPGEFRLKLKGGDAGHNGLKSLMAYTAPAEFKRLYLGIGRPAAGVSVVDHVLGQPSPDDLAQLRTAIEKAANLVRQIPDLGWERALHEFNQRP